MDTTIRCPHCGEPINLTPYIGKKPKPAKFFRKRRKEAEKAQAELEFLAELRAKAAADKQAAMEEAKRKSQERLDEQTARFRCLQDEADDPFGDGERWDT